MQRAEREVTGLGDGERGLDGLEVPELTDEHDVRVLTQDRLERLLEALRVGADLALVDDAVLVLVKELDGIFDGDDVAVIVDVDLVDHGSERGRLARAGRAGDEDEAAWLLRQAFDHGR